MSTFAGRRRGVVLAALSLLALVLHAVVLGGLEWPGMGADSYAPAPAALTVRVLAPAPVPDPVDAGAMATLPMEPVLRKAKAKLAPVMAARDRQVLPPAVGPAPAPPLSAAEEPSAAVAATRDGLEAPLVAQPEPPLAEPPAALPPPAQTSASDRELPVYRTLIPPAMSVRYGLRRGHLRGTGELQWRPDGDRYEARLEGRMAGIAVLTQVSQGGFDEAGVAPLRFTDQRAGGTVRAANFQREVGKITYSGPSVEHTLLLGSQDRLSWMIQLAAVVAAEPQRLQEGGKVVIHVVGARGDSRLWVFRCTGPETITAGAGSALRTVRFVREAAEAHDTRVEVWLDPQRHHIPARALLRNGPDDDGLELLAEEAAGVP